MILSMELANGVILVPTGRGGYVEIKSVSLEDLLERFDFYVAWVKAKPGRLASHRMDEISNDVRQMVIDGYREGQERLAAARVS